MAGDDKKKDTRVFVGDIRGPGGYVGFFEDDGETGYLYVSDVEKNVIVRHVQIYSDSASLGVSESDVEVVWSRDGMKCGVRIWGLLRGIVDLAKNREGRAFLVSRETPGIADSAWLAGFDMPSHS